MRPVISFLTFFLPISLAFLPIDESRQGNKARIAYDLTNEVSTDPFRKKHPKYRKKMSKV